MAEPHRSLLDRLRDRRTPDPPRPMRSLVAASKRISGTKMARSHTGEKWQDEAWDLYDSVGELRFVANALANGMSRARLFAAKLPVGDDEPQPVVTKPAKGEPAPSEQDLRAVEAVAAFGGGSLGRAEVVRRLAVQLFVPGDGWLVGLPPGTLDDDGPSESAPQVIAPGAGDRVALTDLSWHAFSVNEVTRRAGKVTLNTGEGRTEVDEGRVMLIRVWRPHPRRWWTADSPVRSNLPVLRELVGLTKHVGASIDSRLAGAGLLILPQSIEVARPTDPDAGDEPPPTFVDDLMETMTVPIRDRDSAAAVVPLVALVADEIAASIGQENLIRFDTPFDERSKELRDEAIRRLALGLDAPAEVLLGLSESNHWTAWAIDESTIKTHLEPVLALICDAITNDYLRPVLKQAGVADADDYVVWFDTVDLTLRPNRTAEAETLYTHGELTGAAWRREAAFSEDDAPPEVDQAVRMALEMVTQAPSLLQQWELAALVAQIRAVLDGEPAPAVAPLDAPPGDTDTDTDDGDGDGGVSEPGVPDTRDDDPLAASGNGSARSTAKAWR